MMTKESKKKYSDNYFEIINKYKNFHTQGTKKLRPDQTFKGYSLLRWIEQIKKIINYHECNSLIDYGCGKAVPYNGKLTVNNVEYVNVKEYWNINDIQLYDPGVELFNQYPRKKADGVICTDVIEHIPEEDIFIFIDDIFQLANKFVFIVIATIPASKIFDDGMNIHLCLKNKKEWSIIFKEYKKKYKSISQYIEFNE